MFELVIATLDWFGIAVFAVTGALVASRKEMDIFGFALLGTVTGIIRSFNVIQAGGMGDPRALSGGIAEALICTVAGLCVAIPALIFYRYLRGRVDGIVVQMEKHAIRMADALEAARLRERTSPAAAA